MSKSHFLSICKFFWGVNFFELLTSMNKKKFFSTKIYFISNHLLRMPKRLHRCPNRIITSRTRDIEIYLLTHLNLFHPMKSKNQKNNYVQKTFLTYLQAFLGYKFFRKKNIFLDQPWTSINIFYKKLFHL